MADPFTHVRISVPDPQVPYCLWHVDKTGEAVRTLDEQRHTECDTGGTFQGPAQLTVTLVSRGRPPKACDEDPLMPDGSILDSSGAFIRRRRDSFGIYSGSFTITPPQVPGTHPPPVLFRGQIELFDRVGTHQAPLTTDQCSEACDEHIEGWLVADGEDPKFSLHLAIAGMVTGSSGNQEKLLLHLNGPLIRRTP